MDNIKKLAQKIVERVQGLGIRSPSAAVVDAVLRTVHAASLITEEGRFQQGSVTVASPETVDGDRPILKRADYPSFTRLERPYPFTPAAFAKLARAVDKWSGSIAVWGTSPKNLVTWGIVDQLVGTNVTLHRESRYGFGNPGIFTVVIDRPGDFTVYHGRTLLGALRLQTLVLSETAVLESVHVWRKVQPHMQSISSAIDARLRRGREKGRALYELRESWAHTIARICIGLRRLGTGGALLITARPDSRILSVTNPFSYKRLRDAVVLQVLDDLYLEQLSDRANDATSLPESEYLDIIFAQTDAEDRRSEVNGAVKLVTSLAAIDGALLLTPDLDVIGFGVKIGSADEPKTVYDGANFVRKGRRADKIDLSKFGTRHSSVLRYCHSDADAIGVIISQDGHVRIGMTINSSVVLWEGVQLLDQENYSSRVAKRERSRRARVQKLKSELPSKTGYSLMPKTLAELLGN